MASSTRRVVGLSVLAVAATLAAAPVAGQGARLLADFNQRFDTVPGSQPRQMVSLGDTVVFVADAPYPSIWRSDGTSAGTFPLLDGSLGDYPGPRVLGQVGSIALFLPGGAAESGRTGLWRSDGTTLGTFPLTSRSAWWGYSAGSYRPQEADPYHGRLYLLSYSYEDQKTELWRTDGTVAGTERVVAFPRSLDYATITVVDDRLLICFDHEIWRSDGTADGTSLAATIPGGTSAAIVARTSTHAIVEVWDSGLVLYDDALYGIRGRAGGLERVLPTREGRWPTGRVYANGGGAAFLTEPIRSSSDKVIWWTDGTAAGSRAVTGGESIPRSASTSDRWDDHPIAILGERIYFLSDVSSTVVDLSATSRVQRRGQTVLSLGHRAGLAKEHLWVVSLGDRLLFPRLGESGLELWVSDGTAAGSSLLVDACPGPCDSRPRHPFVNGSRLFWVATDARGEPGLWSTDGSSQGTLRLVHGMHSLGPESSLDRWNLAAAGRRWVFAATDDFRGSELWTAEEANDSGRIVADLLFDDPPGCSLRTAVEFAGRTYLGLQLSPGLEWRLFEVDGTAAPRDLLGDRRSSEGHAVVPLDHALLVALPSWPGTVLALDPETGGSLEPFGPSDEEVGPAFRFVGSVGRALAVFVDQLSGDLWITDGSLEGSEHLSGAPCPGGCTAMSAIGERYLLLAGGGQVYSFDAVARELRQLPGPSDSWNLCHGSTYYYCKPTFFDDRGRAYYEYWSPNNGRQRSLWRSDGTPEGTREVVPASGGELLGAVAVGPDLVYAIRPGDTRVRVSVIRGDEPLVMPLWLSEVGAPSGVAEELIGLARGALFGGWDLEHGGELWFLDLVNQRANRLSDFVDLDVSRLTGIPPGRRVIYFTRREPEGLHLWRTDGSVEGTLRLAPLSESTWCGSVTVGDRFYFCNQDTVRGRELWTSDGSPEGTHAVADIWPGIHGSEPSELTVAGSYLYFSADDGVHGREVWVAPIEGGEPCRASETLLCLGGDRFGVGMHRIRPDGEQEAGRAVPLGEERGLFWFFSPDLYEVLVALEPSLSGTGHTQVSIGSTSNVWFALTVEDRASGTSRRYLNPAGSFTSFVDADAFGPPGSLAPRRVDIPLPAGREGEAIAKANGGGASGTCAPSATRLCLLDGRYAVEARWREVDGDPVPAAVARFTNNSGLLGVIGADDPTWIVKLLDARDLTGHLWFFFGGIAADELEITVVEAATGRSRTYMHRSGELPAAADYELF